MEDVKTPTEMCLEMLRLAKSRSHDTEAAHVDADEALVWYLREIGCHEVVELYEQIPKWYA